MPEEEREFSKEMLTGAWEEACTLFQQQLQKSSFAKDYLTGRGLTLETIDRFRIGYAPNDWNFLANQRFIEEKGYPLDCLIQAGLVSRDKAVPDRAYDFFRNRIVFPIFNEKGEVVSATARTLDPKETRKYFNGRGTTIYDKSSTLYGIYHAKKSIRDAGRCFFVEGPFDFLLPYQNGICNVVSPCGTALTAEHISNVNALGGDSTIEKILVFDGDEPGKKAAERVCRENLGEGLNVVLMPWKKDIDELLLEPSGREQLELCLDSSQGSLDFLVDRIKESKGIEVFQKLEERRVVMEELRGPFAKLPRNLRPLYHGELASLLYTSREDVDSFFINQSTNDAHRRGVDGQSQLVRVLVSMAKKADGNGNGIEKTFNYLEGFKVRELLTMPEARAVYDYFRLNLGKPHLMWMDGGLFDNTYTETVVAEIKSTNAGAELDEIVLKELLDEKRMYYPVNGAKKLSQGMLEAPLSWMFLEAITAEAGNRFDSGQYSIETLADLHRKVKSGKLNGKK